jgi:preprotein translocase subunit Sss1
MTPDPDRKPTKDEMRAGGKVAALVLIFLGLFTVFFVWSA